MLTLKDRIKVGLAHYVIHLHFVSCSKYFFFKKSSGNRDRKKCCKSYPLLAAQKIGRVIRNFQRDLG